MLIFKFASFFKGRFFEEEFNLYGNIYYKTFDAVICFKFGSLFKEEFLEEFANFENRNVDI